MLYFLISSSGYIQRNVSHFFPFKCVMEPLLGMEICRISEALLADSECITLNSAKGPEILLEQG